MTKDELSHTTLNDLNDKIIEAITTATKQISLKKKKSNEKISEETKRLINTRRQLRRN